MLLHHTTDPDVTPIPLIHTAKDTQPVAIEAEATELQSASRESVQPLIAEFTLEYRRRRRIWWILWGTMVGSIFPLLGLSMFLINVPHPAQWTVMLSVALQLLVPVALMIPITAYFKPTRRQQALIGKIIESNDLRAVSPLLAGLATRNKAVRQIIVDALITLLPRLRESDSEWLSSTELRTLASLPRWANSNLMQKYYGDAWADLVVADLAALGNIGDRRALAGVEALATTNPTSETSKRIQDAALKCAALLRSRVEKEREGQHLLRASGKTAAKGDTLLKPAMHADIGDVQELPRPSSKD